MNDQEFKEKYDKLKNSKFYQQKMLGWRPLPTISCITIIFVCFAIFFIIMGIIILVFTAQVKEIVTRYDTCDDSLSTPPNTCNLHININEDMKKPIMIYYQVDGVVQNHRFYMDSKSEKQLKGEKVLKEDLKKDKICEYALTKEEMGETGDDLADPCGLIAKTFLEFNDEFSHWKIEGETKEIDFGKEDEKDNIAYQSDIDNYDTIAKKKGYGEHFLVWMRHSPFSNPRKLWGRINQDIKQSSKLIVQIKFKYHYGPKKYIILSTRNIFGGKSMFLGICYIIAGGMSLMASVIFITTYSSFHRKK